MPRLSTTGSAVMGIAGIETSIDGTTPAALTGSTGGWDWLNEDVIVGQSDFGSGFILYTYDVNTLVLAEVLIDGLPVDGANELAAGGDVWAKWLSTEGFRTSDPPDLILPVAGLGAVSETGNIVTVVTRDTGFGLRTYNAAGTELSTLNALLTLPVIRARGDIVSYVDADGWHLRGTDGAVLPYAARGIDLSFMAPALNGTDVWVLETDTDEVLGLRGAAQGNQYVINTGPTSFGPDVRFISPNIARIVYSTNAGESADALVIHDLNVATGWHSVATMVGGVPVFVVQPPLATIPVPVTNVGSYNLRALFQGLYQHPVIDKTTGRMTEPWYRALNLLAQQANAPINLSSPNDVIGVLPEGNGGTGNDEGDVVTHPDNTPGIARSVLGRSANTAGPRADIQATANGQVLMQQADVLVFAGIESVGYWSPLMTGGGATSEMILTSDGDAIMTWVPTP